MDNICRFIKKQRCLWAFLCSAIYISVLRMLFSCVFGVDTPVYITAPIVCVLSVPLTALYLFFVKDLEKKSKKALVFLFIYILPPLFWYLVSRGAYVWNSYLGGEFFFSLSLYISGVDNALWGLGMGVASCVTVILFKFIGGKNEDTGNDTK